MGGNGDSVVDGGGDDRKIKSLPGCRRCSMSYHYDSYLFTHPKSTLNSYNPVSKAWHVMCMIYGPSPRKMPPKMCTHLASLPESPKVAIEMYMQEKSASQE